MKTFKKNLFYKEYEAPIAYGYTAEHKVRTYIEVNMYFDFEQWLRFSVTVPNFSCCRHTPFKAFIRALEHESIGMVKYQYMKEDVRNCGLYNKLDIR